MKIKYKSGYKYVLAEDYEVRVGALSSYGFSGKSSFISYTHDSHITILAGYAWDGASGPTIDTKSTMRASLVHDALYQLMREGLIGIQYRKQADDLFYKILREDGMGKFRAWYYHKAVRRFGKGRELASHSRKVEVAP